MVSTADSLVALISDNYGSTGGGGATPAQICNLLDERTTPPFHSNVESVIVWLPVMVTRTPINMSYVNLRHELQVHVATPTSDDRLKVIIDEVRRVVSTYPISYVNEQYVDQEEDVSDRRMPQHQLKLRVVLEQNMFPSKIAWSASSLDENAIHVNEAAEINTIAEKGTPVDGDILVIEDSAASWVKKKVQLSNLPGGGGGGGETLAQTLALGNETDGANIIIDSLGDLIIYSDDKVTEKARIDGATGNITTVGTIDGTDVSAHVANNTAHQDAPGLITTHTAIATAHQDAPNLIATHAAIATAHQDAPGLIATHAAIATAHQDAPGLIATHAAISGAHHSQSHALAGADHTATGLTIGHVIAADSATTFSWQAPAAGGGTVGGTGTAGKVAKWAAGGADIEDSTISCDGINVVVSGDFTILGEDLKGVGGATHISLPGNLVNMGKDLRLGTGILKDAADNVAITVSGAVAGAVAISGKMTLSTVIAGVSDYDKFLVSDTGEVKFRTGAEVLSDIGAAPTGEAHVLATTGPHTGTLPVTDITNGTDGYYLKGGATTPVYEQRTFTIGGAILDPSAARNIIAFRAPFACTGVEINARQKGGTSTVINARKNGTSNLMSANLTLTNADTWYNSAANQNQSFAVDDWLEIMVVTVGSATEVFIQVEFTES